MSENKVGESTAVIDGELLGDMLTAELVVKGQIPSNCYIIVDSIYIIEDQLYADVGIYEETIH